MFFIRCFKKFPSFRVNVILFVLSPHLHLKGTLSPADRLLRSFIKFFSKILWNIREYLYWRSFVSIFLRKSFNERNQQLFLTTQTPPLLVTPASNIASSINIFFFQFPFPFSNVNISPYLNPSPPSLCISKQQVCLRSGLQHVLCSVHYSWDMVQFIVFITNTIKYQFKLTKTPFNDVFTANTETEEQILLNLHLLEELGQELGWVLVLFVILVYNLPAPSLNGSCHSGNEDLMITHHHHATTYLMGKQNI